MKKTLFLSILLLITFLCACSKYIMYNSVHGIYTKFQVDSICKIERIPSNFNKWIDGSLVDYESNDSIYQYMYIKQYKGKETDEVIYNVLIKDTLYQFNKRVVELNKKKK